ncbi:competence protein CoiA [Domibacillus indicus]|uniref:competence protein CoiA n=1 Tax=Domibacillus indicus TaxID=1437523 RepID=UPI0006967585|nr:competence protein CoiA family protein [Domibacillus indicus]
MLSAVNAQGEYAVLAGPEAKQLAIRLKAIPHFCPQCRGPVLVKAGNINIPHFAHVSSSCNSFSEPESPRHLAGKADLFQWISKTAKASMEARLPEGRQRPDILTGNIAVEFQCSTISAALFKGRTENYTKRGITPFWIYGGKPIERKGKYIKLTSFQRLFLRYRFPLGFYLLSYCPELKGFTIYEQIIPVTPTLCTAERRFIHIKNMSFPPDAVIKGKHSFSLNDFFDEKRKWLDRQLYFQNNCQHPFFKEIYAAGRNPYLLPEQIGLPVRSSMAIRSHPAEWQFYVWAEWPKRSAAETVRRRIKLGHVKEQPLPLASGRTAEMAANEYETLLQMMGNIRSTDSTSMVDKLHNEASFIQKFGETVVNRLIF